MKRTKQVSGGVTQSVSGCGLSSRLVSNAGSNSQIDTLNNSAQEIALVKRQVRCVEEFSRFHVGNSLASYVVSHLSRANLLNPRNAVLVNAPGVSEAQLRKASGLARRIPDGKVA